MLCFPSPSSTSNGQTSYVSRSNGIANQEAKRQHTLDKERTINKGKILHQEKKPLVTVSDVRGRENIPPFAGRNFLIEK